MNRVDHRKQIDNLLSYIYPVNVENNLIRIGSKFDGGYFVYDNLENTDYLISIGIGDNFEFEKDISDKISGISMYDGTIPNIDFNINNAIFFNKNIQTVQDLYSSISNIEKKYENLILKMDIEGDEWNILDQIDYETLNKFKQVIIEFHYFDKMIDMYGFHPLGERSNFKISESIFKKLSDIFYPIYIHANNFSDLKIIANKPIPEVFEITFLRKDFLVNPKVFNFNLWSDINSPNNPYNPEIRWIPNV